MRATFYENDWATAEKHHQAEILEPEERDADLVMTAETYNRISQWILAGETLDRIGIRALCIYRCAMRDGLPSSGIFSPLETPQSHVMTRQMIVTVIGWVVKGKTPSAMGRRAVAAFCAVRKEILGKMSLRDIGSKTSCTKQAISKTQKSFQKKMGCRPAARESRAH